MVGTTKASQQLTSKTVELGIYIYIHTYLPINLPLEDADISTAGGDTLAVAVWVFTCGGLHISLR